MSSLQIRDVDPTLIERLKAIARRERRSLGQQVIVVLEDFVASAGSDPSAAKIVAARLRSFWARRKRPAHGASVAPADRVRDDRTARIQSILDGSDSAKHRG